MRRGIDYELELPNFGWLRSRLGDDRYEGYLLGCLLETGVRADDGDEIAQKLYFVYQREMMKFTFGDDVFAIDSGR